MIKLHYVSNFRIGDRIIVKKAGDVIPKITRNLSAEERIRNKEVEACYFCKYFGKLCKKHNIKIKSSNLCGDFERKEE